MPTGFEEVNPSHDKALLALAERVAAAVVAKYATPETPR